MGIARICGAMHHERCQNDHGTMIKYDTSPMQPKEFKTE